MSDYDFPFDAVGGEEEAGAFEPGSAAPSWGDEDAGEWSSHQAPTETFVVGESGSCAQWLCAPADVPAAEPPVVDPIAEPGAALVIVSEASQPQATAPFEAPTIPPFAFSVDPAAAGIGFLVSGPADSGVDYYAQMVASGYGDPFVGDILAALDLGPTAAGPGYSGPVTGVSVATGLGNIDAAGLNISWVGPPNTVAVDTVTSGTQWLEPGESPNP